MKVKVIKEFVDRHTGVLHKKGSTFECDPLRYEEISMSGEYVEEIKNIEPMKPVKAPKERK